MISDLLSPEDSTKILQNRFKRTDIKFISIELKPISENVEGFLGHHYDLCITYELDNKTETEVFFLKTKPTTQTQVEMCDDLNAYNKEIFIYDILIKEFEKHGYDTSFASKSYYCIPNNSLILENLVHEGYVLSERNDMFDLNQIKCALKALALFHAAGFAYQETKTKELGSFAFEKKYAEFMEEIIFVFFTNSCQFSMKWWNSSFKTINRIIDLLPEDEAYKLQFKNMFNSYPFGKVFIDETKLPKTCGHGDLWSNNMLFKYENDTAVKCCLVDFQICRYFYPSFDVLLVIFANTSAKFREKHLDELYQYYYNVLDETLNNYGCSIGNMLPLKDFYESIRLTKADALLQAVCATLMIYLPKEMLTKKVKEDDEEGLKELMYENTSLCADAFTNDATYRQIASETLRELRDAILILQ